MRYESQGKSHSMRGNEAKAKGIATPRPTQRKLDIIHNIDKNDREPKKKAYYIIVRCNFL